MGAYFSAVGAEMKKSWINAIFVIIFTIGRIIFGWAWLNAGIEKLSWLSDGKVDSSGLIHGLVTNLVGPTVTRFDPLGLNQLYAWIANNLFIPLGGLTDFLVVLLEFLVGLFLILGFQIFWSALVAVFMNLQYITAGSFNNFGYIWTDLILMKFPRYAGLIGIDGYIRFRKGKELLNAPKWGSSHSDNESPSMKVRGNAAKM